MSVTSPSRSAEGAQHRRSASAVAGSRIGLGVLLAGIVAATVAVPPLITPKHRAAPPPAPVAGAPSVAPVTSFAPSSPPSPTPSPSAPPRAVPSLGPCRKLGGGTTVDAGAAPSCGIYDGSLGTGWTAVGNGLKVVPGSAVPDTGQPAMRVERTRPSVPATTMALVASGAVGVGPGDRLTLAIWGGRDFGTVLRLSVAPGGTGSVTLTAPADRWTRFTVRLDQVTRGRSLSRIDLAVAADQVAHVNRFFLDDVTLG